MPPRGAAWYKRISAYSSPNNGATGRAAVADPVGIATIRLIGHYETLNVIV